MLTEKIQNMKIFLKEFDDINIMLWLIIITTILFLFVYRKSSKGIFRPLSIIFGFIPVLTHELGHAITCTLTKGRVKDIHMVLSKKEQFETNTQGYALTQPTNRFGMVLTAFMGYITPPLTLLIGIICIENGWSIIFVSLLIGVTFYYFFMSKQKLVSVIPLLLMILVLYNIYHGHITQLQLGIDVVFNIYFGLLLGETIESILITANANFKQHGIVWDGSILRKMTFIPSTVWFCLWSSFSIFTIGYIGYLLTL